jgi:hypothetical protein
MTERLTELRSRIQKEAPFVGVRPYSHNIIRMTLAEIDEHFGRTEANKAVRDCKLEQKGFNQEPEVSDGE